ncbi:DUF2179 domain-containing protein [bacterium]|nr:DUF2179 domain-containing protein [candidate division CSSED10-310 bacterium]
MFESLLDTGTLLMGILVFFARVVDVSVGTIRTISTVNGRMKTAFILGCIEVSVWILIVSKVITEISNKPVLVVFYALGFSTGNVLGILVERRIGFGYIGLRIICLKKGIQMAKEIRDAGYAVTAFEGEGKSGRVIELYMVCKRKNLKPILDISRSIEPDAFFITENVGSVRNSAATMPPHQPTGWRSIVKKR